MRSSPRSSLARTASDLRVLGVGLPLLALACGQATDLDPENMAESAALAQVFQAAADFSATQGFRGWYYLDRDGGGLDQPMTFDAQGNHWQGREQYSLLWSAGGHPGNAYAAVLRWKAPVAGSLRITGRTADAHAGCGTDGVSVSIQKGSTVLWSRTIPRDDTGGSTFDLTASVASGENIDFVIQKGVDNGCDSTAFDPRIELSPPTWSCPVRSSYQASTDFSATQGQNCWSYLDSTGAPLTWDAGGNRWRGVEPYLLLWSGGGHPGNGRDAVLRWTAPQAGSARVTGRASDGHVGCGTDGVVASIRKGQTSLWQRTIAKDDTAGASFDLTANLAAGEALDFVIHKGADNGCDSTRFDPAIGLTAGGDPGGDPIPTFTSEVVLFEDGIRFGSSVPPLVYRVEGSASGVQRSPAAAGGAMRIRGRSAVVHAAQLERAALRVRMNIHGAGQVLVAVGHNGMTERSGRANASPGAGVRIRSADVQVVDLASQRVLGTIGSAFPREAAATLGVAWDAGARTVRVEMNDRAYTFSGISLPRGGFGIRGDDDVTNVDLLNIKALWQDSRPIVLYSTYNEVFDLAGNFLRSIPPVRLPVGMSTYVPVSIDLVGEQVLLAYGDAGLDAMNTGTIRGYGVRKLASGALDDLGPTVNGCYPQQGGASFDGYALNSSPPTQSMYWLDWNAYRRGDGAHFCAVARAASGDFTKGPGPFEAWADPANALDGSIARYLHITETWQGETHLFVHPNLIAFAGFGDIAFPSFSSSHVSHTGPAGWPTQLAVRDQDRAYLEEWAYPGGGHGLHTRNRGINLFTSQLDWSGPDYPWQAGSAAFNDWANMAPSFTNPGEVFAPKFTFNPQVSGAAQITLISADRLRANPGGGFTVVSRLNTLPSNAAGMLYPALLTP